MTAAMKRTLFLICLLMSLASTRAQNVSVEKSVFGVQTGLLGLWGHNEFRLADKFSFRSEIGFDAGFWGGSFYEEDGYVITPVISVQPRWYYNLSKRQRKEKRIDGNSGNFLALRLGYHPDWFNISNQDVNVVSDVSIIPMWGIRRNIGKHFNFETGAGVGYVYYFAKNAGYLVNDSDVVLNILLRIGYKFKTKN